jgi:bifunctional non-homologous end joining protein LigD
LPPLDDALRSSEHVEGDGEAIFRHACALGLEGIVSKRRDRAIAQAAVIKNPAY